MAMEKSDLMFVVFGRPGAGKTTISQAAVALLGDGDVDSPCSEGHRRLYLDLDVCVPQWMRDNFSKGIYPTLQQRAEFISNACDYVKGEIASATTKSNDHSKPLVTIVSFSFVNTDLRTAFREEFPHARWILVDTGKRLSEERILAREGHFYKNASSEESNSNDDTKKSSGNDATDDNSEWEFRPVDFPHIALDGRDSVDVNAKRIARCIECQLSGEKERTV